MTPASLASGALGTLPVGLRKDLLDAFEQIVKNFREHRWSEAELNGGKFCEAVFTVVLGYLDGGNYAQRASKPANMPSACWNLATQYPQGHHSARLLIPRMILGLYDVRNSRGVGHAGGDVDPNLMDATVVLYMAKWLMAELVRLLHSLDTDAATDVVETLIEREVHHVWSHGDQKRVLTLGLTRSEQILLLLLTVTGAVKEAELTSWLEHKRPSDLRTKVLRPMHAKKLIFFDETAKEIRLLPPGVSAAEDLAARLSAK